MVAVVQTEANQAANTNANWLHPVRHRKRRAVNDAILADVARVVSDVRAVEQARAALALDLTPREVAVMELTATGMGNQQIAERLFIDSTTVKNHKTSIFRKLKVTNSIEAIRAAVRAGLVEFP